MQPPKIVPLDQLQDELIENRKVHKRIQTRTTDLIFLMILITLFVTAVLITPDSLLYQWLVSSNATFRNVIQNPVISYPILFVIGIIGDLLAFHPHLFITYTFAQQSNAWWYVGLFAGLGAGLGSVIGSVLWNGVSKNDYTQNFQIISDYLGTRPKLTPFIIFIGAFLPMGDDLVSITLGLGKYPVKKMIFPTMFGKTLFFILLAYLGFLSKSGSAWLDTVVANNPFLFFLYLFIPSSDENPSATIMELVFIVLILYVLIRIDMEKVVNNRMPVKALEEVEGARKFIEKCQPVNQTEFLACIEPHIGKSRKKFVKEFKKCAYKFVDQLQCTDVDVQLNFGKLSNDV